METQTPNISTAAAPIRPLGLMTRIPESRLQATEKAEETKKQAQDDQSKPEMISLASHIKTAWQAALRAKQGIIGGGGNIEQRFLQCLRRRNGEYDPEKLREIQKFGGSPIYMMLSNVKCRAFESWVKSIMLPAGDKPWGLSPTPVPDLPQGKEIEIQQQVQTEVVQLMLQGGIDSVSTENIQDRLEEIKDKVLKEKQKKAKKGAQRMELQIQDQLSEGNYYQALREFITDLATFPTAFLKGPVIHRKKTFVWTEDQQSNWVPAVEIKPIREYERVSGFDIYPSPGAKSVQDGYLCERARIRRADLQVMIGVPGFNEQAIRAVLQEYGEGGLRQWLSIDSERALAERRPDEFNDPDPPIDTVIFWGSIQGKKLLEWGMGKDQVPDADIDYQITAWLIGKYVVMARLNPHPLGLRPYYAASAESVNDSVWGKGPPELFKDCQDICNAAARSIVNNMAIASGPQVEVYKNRIDPAENIEDIYPWKIWKTEDDGTGANNPAIRFYQPPSVVDVLLKIYEFFFQQASEQSGIPAYVYGNKDVGGGAGNTASGLSMLLNAAGKMISGVIAHIDEKIIAPSIKEHWNHIMMYDTDIDKMGDINVIARASEQLIVAEQLQLRRSEMLDRTNNPWDQKIIGDKGRAHMLKDAFDSMKMDTESIIPTDDELDAMQAEALKQLEIEQNAQGIPPAAVIDAAGGKKGQPPGQTITARGLKVK